MMGAQTVWQVILEHPGKGKIQLVVEQHVELRANTGIYQRYVHLGKRAEIVP
ncbi:hypothetical protein D3C84_871380 [compost metagenome]